MRMVESADGLFCRAGSQSPAKLMNLWDGNMRSVGCLTPEVLRQAVEAELARPVVLHPTPSIEQILAEQHVQAAMARDILREIGVR